ncbi:MAG: hypothetical protein ABIJ92_01125 [Candidatus Aenigmatarchaeota archaeon]
MCIDTPNGGKDDLGFWESLPLLPLVLFAILWGNFRRRWYFWIPGLGVIAFAIWWFLLRGRHV